VTGDSWKATCVKYTVCTNSIGELNVNSFVQQFAKGSFSNITTMNQFKITVFQLRDEFLFVKLKLDPCLTRNLLMKLLLSVLLCATESEQYTQRHCTFWSMNAAITGYIP
jgi:hypothetical protein